MARAALAALLLCGAAALALPALSLVALTPGQVMALLWPLILVAAGAAGLRRGLGWALYGRWVPAGTAVLGLMLFSARLADVPLRALLLAGLLAWAGLTVALAGVLHERDPRR